MQERPVVVVGVDGSAYSRAALTYAMEEAARRGTGVQVVSAFLPPQYRPDAYGLTAPPTPDEMRSDLRFLARRMVDEVVAEVPALAAVPVELHELEGSRPRSCSSGRGKPACSSSVTAAEAESLAPCSGRWSAVRAARGVPRDGDATEAQPELVRRAGCRGEGT